MRGPRELCGQLYSILDFLKIQENQEYLFTPLVFCIGYATDYIFVRAILRKRRIDTSVMDV